MDERFELIRRALLTLEETGKLPEGLPLSGSAFHRLFVRYTGVTPKDFTQQLALVKAKGLLRQRGPVLASALEAGLSSGGRLHDLFLAHAGMTPGSYKRGGEGLTLGYAVVSTPFGNLLLAGRSNQVCALRFFDAKLATALSELRDEWPEAKLEEAPRRLAPLADEILLRLRGQVSRRLTLSPRGSAFQLQVWEALLRIPEGRTTTYGELARFLGRPLASRAVGTAIGKNPIGLLIPCHRVIRGSGAMGGYRWGEGRKELLLAGEACKP